MRAKCIYIHNTIYHILGYNMNALCSVSTGKFSAYTDIDFKSAVDIFVINIPSVKL